MICNRRTFITAASGVALGTRMAAATAQGANNRIRIGVIGTGGRTRGLMSHLKKLPGNEMVSVCDVYEPRLLQAAADITDRTVTKVADYRRILDDREIDAVVIGTPDHWHKAITLDAVAAGKDVYVEKPVSHTIEEGAEMVKAIEASKQIVQTGTQQRSWDHWVQGKQIIDSGRLGQITFIQTYWYQHATAGKYPPVSMDKLDWKRWLGSAPDQPFRPERFFQWRHFWDFGGGCLTDLMTHWIDVVHWYMDVDAPLSVAATGHNYNL
jgi:predicted dehydrogenase